MTRRWPGNEPGSPATQVRGVRLPHPRQRVGDATSGPPSRPAPPGQMPTAPGLRALLAEIEVGIEGIVGATRDRMDALLDAVLVVSTGLDLEVTLRRIVQSAMDLVGARYGALWVLDQAGTPSRFIPVGVTETTRDLIGRQPTGQGVLGVILDDKPLRLPDLSRHPRSVGFPTHHPPMRTLLGVPVRARGTVFGRLYLSEKDDGQEFTPDDEAVMQALARAAGIAIDNAHQYERARRRQHWLEATSQITTELLADGDINDALGLIARCAQELTAAHCTLIALPAGHGTDSGATELTVAACVGAGAEQITGRRIPVSGSTTGAVFADHTPRSVPHPAFDVAAGLGIRFGPALALPLGINDPLGGVLLIVRQPGCPAFTDDELRLASTFADQAALARQRAERRATRMELEILADHDRIARDLHDRVIQQLFGVGLALNGIQGRVTEPELARRLNSQIDELDLVIRDIRAVICDLRTDPDPPSGPQTQLPPGPAPDRQDPPRLDRTQRWPPTIPGSPAVPGSGDPFSGRPRRASPSTDRRHEVDRPQDKESP